MLWSVLYKRQFWVSWRTNLEGEFNEMIIKILFLLEGLNPEVKWKHFIWKVLWQRGWEELKAICTMGKVSPGETLQMLASYGFKLWVMGHNQSSITLQLSVTKKAVLTLPTVIARKDKLPRKRQWECWGRWLRAVWEAGGCWGLRSPWLDLSLLSRCITAWNNVLLSVFFHPLNVAHTFAGQLSF